MNKRKIPKDEGSSHEKMRKVCRNYCSFFYSKYRLTPSKRKHISEDIRKDIYFILFIVKVDVFSYIPKTLLLMQNIKH